MSRFIKLILVVGVVVLSGCKDKGKDFIGHWENIKDAKSSSLDISYSDGIYHIDVNSLDKYITQQQKVIKLEGQAVSDTVLTVHAGLGNVDMRLKDDKVFFENHVYQRPK